MIAEVLKSQKTNRPLTDTFERDWEKAISGEEFVNRTHKH